MKHKYAYFSVDLELLCDIPAFQSALAGEPDFTKEVGRLFDFFEAHAIKATFFASANYIAQNPRLITHLLAKGHALGLHDVDHTLADVHINEFTNQIRAAKQTIEQDFKTVVGGYRAPAFKLSNAEYHALAALGFTYDSSYFAYRRAANLNNFEPDATLREFPVWSKQSFPLAGGAYIRLLPTFIAKFMLKAYIRQNMYYNFYIHPYDISPQKFWRGDASRRMKLFFGRGRATYLRKVTWLVKTLYKEGYTIRLYEEELQ